MSMLSAGTSVAKSDINVTPLIDVLLVLLIIFMVITPLTPRGLDAVAPQPDRRPPVTEPERAVVIELDENRAIQINSGPIEEKDLHQRLLDIFRTRAERVVFVKADARLDFSSVSHIIDIAKGARIEKVGLMTTRIQTGG